MNTGCFRRYCANLSLFALATCPIHVCAQTPSTAPDLAPSASPPLPQPSTTAAAETDVSVAKADGRTPEERHAEALVELRAGRNGKAVLLLKQLCEIEPKSALYVTDLGFAYLKQGKFVEAYAAFRQGIALDPARPHAYVHLVDATAKLPNRWEKRHETFVLLEQGLAATHNDLSSRIRIELAKARAEYVFGLLAKAKQHLDPLRESLQELGTTDRALSGSVRRQLQELEQAIQQDERARHLEDWPEPVVSEQARFKLTEAAKLLKDKQFKAALERLAPLIANYPAWRKPRELRTDALTALDRYDEATSELDVITRLAPSNANAHRKLGLLLAEHGGLLSANRADEALRIALALEPEWLELEAVRKRLAERRSGPVSAQSAGRRGKPPTDNAVRLFEESQGLLDTGANDLPHVRELLEQSLRESPNYVAAAAALYALTGTVPKATTQTLWNDGEGLYLLYQELHRLSPPPPDSLWLPWLERAMVLGFTEAHFARALYDFHRGASSEALLHLSNYLALVRDPQLVDAAQALRAEVTDRDKSYPKAEVNVRLQARIQLQSDKPELALKTLNAPCTPNVELSRLLALGMVYERLLRFRDALSCYSFALDRPSADPARIATQKRMARLLARVEDALLVPPFTNYLSQLTSVEPAAFYALARRERHLGNDDATKKALSTYLAQVSPDDRFLADAQVLSRELQRRGELALDRQRKARRQFIWLGVGSTISLLGAAYWFFFRGSTVTRAIRRRAELYPDLARLVGELRHDVLKHRTSALGLLRDGQTTRALLKPALLEPVPCSRAVANAYTQLQRVARAEGVTLRRLQREPIFGSLARDLSRVEALLDREEATEELLDIDVRLRTVHAEQLKQLLALGPRCEVDAAALQTWILALKAELRPTSPTWTVPALSMSDLNLQFPIAKQALYLIFSNLLRNAQAAVAQTASPKLIVTVTRKKDFTGQTLAMLLVGDNAPEPLTLESIESRQSGRGLAILRDTTRHWRGQLLVLPGDAQYRKYVGVQFTQ